MPPNADTGPHPWSRTYAGAMSSAVAAPHCLACWILAFVEPGHERRVVRGGVSEGGTRQAAAGLVRQAAVGAQFLEDLAVVGRVDYDADVGVVLGRGAHHRGTAHVDHLDRWLAAEW